MDDTPKNVTWKATLIGTAMTLASSTAGYISSHWGGQTLESAAKDKKELKAFIEESAKTTAATVEDSHAEVRRQEVRDDAAVSATEETKGSA
jgi:hypothetical protein